MLPLLSGCASSSRMEAMPGSLHDTLPALAEQHQVCAVAVAVIRHRQLAEVETATGCPSAPAVHAGSVFQAASLSKPVFAYAVLQLAAQGKLALDAPLAGYLPQGYRHQYRPWQAQPSELVTDPRLQAVTARMVLNHTSGLPNWASGPLWFDFDPGAKWGYSGEGYVLLQRVVETVTGQPLDRFMEAQVFGPLAMQDSSYVWKEGMAPLPGTKANGAPRGTLQLTAPVAAYSLYTTAQDYGKFLAAVLGDRAMLAHITASPVPVDAALGVDWGLGWGVGHGRDGDYVWQWGNNPGYRAFVMASVRTGDGVVMLTNSENGLKLAEPVVGKVLPGQHKLFKFSSLQEGALGRLCSLLRICF